MKKILILSIVIPPIIMAAIIYHYEKSKKQSNDQYLAREVEYQRPVTVQRIPAEQAEQLQKKALLHEAFSH